MHIGIYMCVPLELLFVFVGNRRWSSRCSCLVVHASLLLSLAVLSVDVVLLDGLRVLTTICFDVVTISVPSACCPCMVSAFRCWKFANLGGCLCTPGGLLGYLHAVVFRMQFPLHFADTNTQFIEFFTLSFTVDHCRLRGGRSS